MRHGNKVNNLSRKTAHRRAMLANMACSLIEHKRISTTLAKAKALRVYVEPLITKSKSDTTHSRRVVFSYLQSKEAVTTLFLDVAEKISDRPGGYTRILKLGTRLGDNAEMAMIELVDFNEIYTTESKPTKKKKKSRRGGGSGAAKTEPAAKTTAPEVKVEEAEAKVPKAEAKTDESSEASAKDDESSEAPAKDDKPSSDESSEAPEKKSE